MEYHILGKICYKTSNNKWISGIERILEASILKNKFSYQVENQDYFSNTNIGKKKQTTKQTKTKQRIAVQRLLKGESDMNFIPYVSVSFTYECKI